MNKLGRNNLKVGYTSSHYAINRNILIHEDEFNYRKIINYFKIIRGHRYLINYISKTLTKKCVYDNHNYGFSYNDYNLLPYIDLIHFFNTINYGKKPWITTYETIVPRYRGILKCFIGKEPDLNRLDNPMSKVAFNALASKSCKYLIAISQNAYNTQTALIQHHAPSNFNEILSKMIVMHPPQYLYINDYRDKMIEQNKRIVFTFIGSDFFRKGGVEILNSFEKVYTQYKNIKLNIIGKINTKDYYIKDKDRTLSILSNSSYIEYKGQLPNERVYEVMKNTHVGLLPSIAETYGYSVLEFQASGCPVITTDIQALSEINNNDIGWIIKLPKNKFGYCVNLDYINNKPAIVNEEDKKVRGIIQDTIYSYILEIMKDPEIIKIKAGRCMRKIKDMHSPAEHYERILKLYSVK